jgi:hypothetical protein
MKITKKNHMDASMTYVLVCQTLEILKSECGAFDLVLLSSVVSPLSLLAFERVHKDSDRQAWEPREMR